MKHAPTEHHVTQPVTMPGIALLSATPARRVLPQDLPQDPIYRIGDTAPAVARRPKPRPEKARRAARAARIAGKAASASMFFGRKSDRLDEDPFLQRLSRLS